MKFDMVNPCNNCPFRNDGAGIELCEDRKREIVEALNCGTFACHKTVDYSKDPEDREDNWGEVTADSQHCAGALIMLEHDNKPGQMMRIAERLGMYSRHKLNMAAPVHESTDDFVYAG